MKFASIASLAVALIHHQADAALACKWIGHCLGDSCRTYNDCDHNWVCTGGKCAEPAPITTKAPVTTTKAPVTTTKAPVTTTKAPVTTTKAPVTTTKAPVTTTEAPVTTTKAPTTTDSSTATGTCDPNYVSCQYCCTVTELNNGYCVSEWGYCGTGIEWCNAKSLWSKKCLSSVSSTTPTTTATAAVTTSSSVGTLPTSEWTWNPYPVASTPRNYYYGEGCNIPGVIALTFDDGSSPYTQSLLDSLNALSSANKQKVHVTFFVLGQTVEQYAAVMKKSMGYGHTYGTHSYDHKDFTTLSTDAQASQWDRTDAAFAAAGLPIPAHARLPYFAESPSVIDMAMNTKKKSLFFTNCDSNDWRDSVSTWTNTLKTCIDTTPLSGSLIILVHDILQDTVNNIGPVIQYGIEKGFRFVALDECTQSGAYVPPPSGSSWPPAPVAVSQLLDSEANVSQEEVQAQGSFRSSAAGISLISAVATALIVAAYFA